MNVSQPTLPTRPIIAPIFPATAFAARRERCEPDRKEPVTLADDPQAVAKAGSAVAGPSGWPRIFPGL